MVKTSAQRRKYPPRPYRIYAFGRMVYRRRAPTIPGMQTTLDIDDLCQTLGVPRTDGTLFAKWAAALVGSELARAQAREELHAYLDVLIATRCRRLTADLVSDLIRADYDYDEIRQTVGVLLAAVRPPRAARPPRTAARTSPRSPARGAPACRRRR